MENTIIKEKQTTKDFYDNYWPANVPNYKKTKEHVFSLLGEKNYKNALDAGCGTGACSLALAEKAERVTAIDLSEGSLNTAKDIARYLNLKNIAFQQADMLQLPFQNSSFDLVWGWGVIHHTKNPEKALAELIRVLAPGGTVILAVYLKTKLTWLHETIRHRCLKMNRRQKKFFIGILAGLTGLFSKIRAFGKPLRDDNPLIKSKIEDWYFVPEKHFFKIKQIQDLFREHGLSTELLHRKTGRIKSTSNFIIMGTKPRKN